MRKVTFTFDDETVARLDRTAQRLGMPKSRVVREAILEYAEQLGRLGEREHIEMLAVFDDVIGRIPDRPEQAVDREIETVRQARRRGGRRSRTGDDA